ncbi:MAG: TetR/AcrR family transcriptional regulator [bacterium]|nr:TetR/AcrR family transcriptional regulator [bacterium]
MAQPKADINPTGEPADHRVRVARERRDRMRQRLLDAVMASYGKHLQEGLPQVEDVVLEADVSRATFYKYFSSVEQAVDLLGQDMSGDMVRSAQALLDGTEDPFFQMTTAIQLHLMRATIDPVWAAFVARANTINHDSGSVEAMTAHLTYARDQGILAFADVDAAASLGIGAVSEAMRRMARKGPLSRSYVDELATMVLMAFGMERNAAREIVRQRTIFIRGLGPDRLDWWRDPWL